MSRMQSGSSEVPAESSAEGAAALIRWTIGAQSRTSGSGVEVVRAGLDGQKFELDSSTYDGVVDVDDVHDP